MTSNSPSSKSNRQAEFESLSTSLIERFMGEVSTAPAKGGYSLALSALTRRDSSCIVQVPVLGLWLRVWRHHCRGAPKPVATPLHVPLAGIGMDRSRALFAD